MPDSSPETVADTATTTDITAAVTAEPNSDGQAAASSTAETAGSMLDAVKTALAPKEASPASEEPGEAAEATSSAPKAEQTEDDGELSEEELKAVSQKTRNRFSRLKSKLDAKDTEIGDLKSKVGEFDKINKFVTDAGLNRQEFDYLLNLGSLIKADKRQALEQLLPIIGALQRDVGEVLPADLREQVRLGYLTEQHARELNKARAGERMSREQAERVAGNARRDAEQRQQQTLIDTALTAAAKWEAAKATSDPDWPLKRDEVAEKVKLAVYEESAKHGGQYFPTAEEVVKLSDEALKRVNARFKRASKPEIKPVIGGVSPRSAPAPKSMLDVVRNVVSG